MKPRIFIASSLEGKPIAETIQSNFSHDAYPTVWHQLTFTLSSYPLESLLDAVSENDFAVMVLSPDDVLRIRNTTAVVPRGNVLFEAALFMGKHGRDRTFLVQPRNHPAFKLPSDLGGVIPATYDEDHFERNPAAALGPACGEIRHAMGKSKSFKRSVSMLADLELDNPATTKLFYPKKLAFQISNPTSSPVVLTSHHFKMNGQLAGHRKRRSTAAGEFKVEFFLYKNSNGKDVHDPTYLLQPAKSCRAWLALDDSTDDAKAKQAFANKQIGTWRLSCRWLTEPMEERECNEQF